MSLMTAALLVCILAATAGVGLYLYQRKGSGQSFRLFGQRPVPRLEFIERTKLEGGRKLLLVRRDEVEHLILIGGPIDLIVETGIQPVALANLEVKASGMPGSEAISGAAWQRQEPAMGAAKPVTAFEPRLPLSSKEGGENGLLELSPLQEAKAS